METFAHEITIEARHYNADGTETTERVYAELTHDKADPRRAAEHVLYAAGVMLGGFLRPIDLEE